MDIELTPKLLTGRLVRITDINAVIELKGRMGMIHLPLRSLFADHKMAVGDEVEIYLSYARVHNDISTTGETICN